MADKAYNWKFVNLGGMARVNIQTGEDIAHLGELDRKLWTVLSCPVAGLEFDQKTLKLIDTDNDGKIRVDEIVATANYLTSALSDKDLLVKQTDVLPLSALNQEDPNGAKIFKSAQQILRNLGKPEDTISLADSSDSIAIFAQTRFNGDGVITPASAEDEALKATIEQMIATVGSVADRSGAAGVNEALIEQFYAACADYTAWVKESVDGKDTIYPYGENTAAALAAVEAVKAKLADYFLRCKLVRFDDASAAALDVSVDRISAISAGDITACTDEIATYPVARVSANQELPLDAINPAWQAAFDNLKKLVLDVDFPGATTLTEAQWSSIVAKFGAYTAWTGSKKGAEVESLGVEGCEAALKADHKAALLDLVAQDCALAEEAGSIDAVDDFLHLVKYFYQLLKNYVSLSDFYGKKVKAIFQAGTLFIDQRSCDLCIRVADMGKQGDMAGLSGMFLIYCDCVSKPTGKKATIAAVLTDGDVNDIRVGKNAIFYDRDGVDYDAVVTKVVDNPISIRSAFWSPYRKFANTISERIAKSAAEKDAKVSADMTAKANDVKVPTSQEEKDAAVAAAPKPASNFDIAKFAGIFAAIGMALGFIGQALVALIKPWYTPFIVILVLVICISGPSMFLAWLKLRKRNLAPVLNANGWAINAKAIVNIVFGQTLTSLAKFPKLGSFDPETKKQNRKKTIRRWCITVVVVLAGVAALLYFTGCFGCCKKEKAADNSVLSVAAFDALTEEEQAGYEMVVTTTNDTTYVLKQAPVEEEPVEEPAAEPAE